jgi:hypothetical protein
MPAPIITSPCTKQDRLLHIMMSPFFLLISRSAQFASLQQPIDAMSEMPTISGIRGSSDSVGSEDGNTVREASDGGAMPQLPPQL